MEPCSRRTDAFRVSYVPDGSGRDTFKIIDNGGFYKSYLPAPASPVTTFATKKSFQSPSPALNAKSFYYQSDGYGRDRYIEINSGGLHGQKSNVHAGDAYKQSLRSYDRSVSPNIRRRSPSKTIRANALSSMSSMKSIPDSSDYVLQSQSTYSVGFAKSQSV